MESGDEKAARLHTLNEGVEQQRSPFVSVTFNSTESSAKAWEAVAWGRPTISPATNEMLVDVTRLRVIKELGIPVYLPSGIKNKNERAIDIDRLITKLEQFQGQIEDES